MKIFSEKTNKYYANVEDCLKAEKEFDAAIKAEEERKKGLSENRKARAKAVEDSYKAVLDANKVFREKLNKFVEDYGSFHMTIDTEIDDDDFFSLFNGLTF